MECTKNNECDNPTISTEKIELNEESKKVYDDIISKLEAIEYGHLRIYPQNENYPYFDVSYDDAFKALVQNGFKVSITKENNKIVYNVEQKKTQDQMLEQLELMQNGIDLASFLSHVEEDTYDDGFEQGYKRAIGDMCDFIQE